MRDVRERRSRKCSRSTELVNSAAGPAYPRQCRVAAERGRRGAMFSPSVLLLTKRRCARPDLADMQTSAEHPSALGDDD